MENAADALHMAFAMFIFVIAVSLAFATFSQAREVADVVLYYNDKTNFEEYVAETVSSNRIVGLESIIPAVRKYIHENDGYSIEIVDGNTTRYVFDITEQNENGIITESQLTKYCEEKLKEIIKKYKNDTFTEKYSETIYSGGREELSDGETIEEVNTRTKIIITYIKN